MPRFGNGRGPPRATFYLSEVPVELVVLSLAGVLALYASFVLALFSVGRRSEARALTRFIPDCLVLFRRLLADSRVPRARKLALVLMLGYLALPIDLIPDFIPVAGQLDDVILVALVLRFVLRGAGRDLVDEHWPGPPEGLAVVKRFAFPWASRGPVFR